MGRHVKKEPDFWYCDACGTPLGENERHVFMIPRGPHGALISLKADYIDVHVIDGPNMRPRPAEFQTGDRVKVTRFADWSINQQYYARWKTTCYTHWGETGTVIGKTGDRLYAVEFIDGTTASYYHNELDPEETP